MVRVLTSLMIAAAVLASTAGCGSHGGVAQGPGITLFQPTTLYSNGSSALRILGKGFGARKSKVTVRFTAETGTPFANGTSATFETEATVDSDTQIRGTAPASFANADVATMVTVILGDGTELASEGPVANVVFQQILGMTPASVSSGVTPPFTISGQGFQPPLGLVTVRFTSTTGTPFAGGTSATINTIGTVENDTTISGLFPDGQVAFDTDASVTVILPDGAQISSSGPLVHWIPIPTVVAFSPSTIPGGQTVAYEVTGTAYAPTGSTATITLEATTGTPFFGGTSATVSFPGTVDGPTQITGTTPPLNPSVAGLAYVRITLQGGSTAISATPLVQFVPPPSISTFAPSSFTSGSPNPWDTVGPNVGFSITGQNFGSPGSVVGLIFTASSGTPFNNGTSSTFAANATVGSNTVMSGNFPDPLASVGATGSILATFPSGATASLSNAWTVSLAPTVSLPAWNNSFGTGVGSGGRDDTTFSQSLSFSFPYYSSSYTACFFNSNGSISFGGGDTSFQPSVSSFVGGVARIAPWWGDIYPGRTGGQDIYFSSQSTTATATWSNCPTYSGNVSMQIVMYNNGRIDWVHQAMADSNGGLIGLTPGGNQASSSTVDFSTVNWTACANFSGVSPNQQIGGASDLANDWVLFYPDGTGGYDWATGP